MSTCSVRGCYKPPVQMLVWIDNNEYNGTLHRFCEDHKVSDFHKWSRQLMVRDE